MASPTSPASPRNANPRGFSLTELLVVIGLLALIVALLLPAIRTVQGVARKSREVASGRSIFAAWTGYATDAQGQVMPGFKTGLPAWVASGERMPADAFGGGPTIAARWPWRLAPYLSFDMRGLFLGGEGETYERLVNGDPAQFYYFTSLYPAFGMNSAFVGGDSERYGFLPASLPNGSANPLSGFYVTRLSSIVKPASLTVFAGARTNATADGTIAEGFFRIESPFLADATPRWAAAYDPLDPASCGNLSARHGDEVVVVNAAGGVESVQIDVMRDMRRWANGADRADWHILP